MEELSWDSPGCVASLAATQWKNKQTNKQIKDQEVSMVLLAPLLLEHQLFLLGSPEPGNY